MKTTIKAWALLLLGTFAAFAYAQERDDKAGADERDPSLKHWQWMVELRLPEKIDGPYVAINLTPELLAAGQLDPNSQPPMEDFRKFPKEAFAKEAGELRDLRLTDAKGNRIPFALRIMSNYAKSTDARIVRKFNAAPSPKSRIYEASYELADVPAPGHNEIEIYTTGGGRDFRRKVEVFGDDNDQFTKPKSLLGKGKYLVHYEVDSKVVDIHRFSYSEMQYKYLQVRVHADDLSVDEEIPTIASVVVRRRIEMPGEFVTEPVFLSGMDQVRTDSGPGTAWMITLRSGRMDEKGADIVLERIPCQKLTFEFLGEPSERPMRLEIADPGQPRQTFYGADFQWRTEAKRPEDDPRKEEEKRLDMPKRSFLDVRFGEVIAQRLRLVVTDKANPPLNLNRVEATRAVRKVIFENPDPAKTTLPLRLYVGNPSIGGPGYVDFAKKLPEVLNPPLPLATLNQLQPNPSYEPPPKPLHERMPWLVYAILGAASVVLLLILAALVKQAIARHDGKNPE